MEVTSLSPLDRYVELSNLSYLIQSKLVKDQCWLVSALLLLQWIDRPGFQVVIECFHLVVYGNHGSSHLIQDISQVFSSPLGDGRLTLISCPL